jgi:N-acyl-D-amino-acid deacylase
MKSRQIKLGRRSILILAVSLLSVLLLTLVWYRFHKSPVTCDEDFDIALIGGELMDGLGGLAFKADVGISKGQIACVGIIDPTHARKVISASGLIVSPGFIDVHTHVERNVPNSRAFLAGNFVRQGVTTVITGNCGRSAPDLGKFFKLLARNGSEVNVASFVGHNTIRLQVMRESALAPNDEQLAKMKGLVSAAMHDGALGLSTGLEYIPGAYSKTDELVELAKTARQSGGMYASHIRDEGPNGEAAILEAISVGERAGVHVHISHFKAQGPRQWGSAARRLEIVKAALRKGLNITLDQYPYTASSTGLIVLLPSWLSEGGLSKAQQRLREPSTRKKVRDEMLRDLRALGWNDYSFARIAYCESDHSLVGLSIPEVALKRAALHTNQASEGFAAPKFVFAGDDKQADKGTELERQADAVIDVYTHGGAQMVFFNMDEGDVQTIMKTPEVMFGSDSSVREENALALPHPRGLGTFPRVLGAYARDKHLFSLEEAVRRMTSLPADTFGFKDRGQIHPGYWADVVVFDGRNVIDTATYDRPLGSPEGIRYVLVNGEVVFDQGYLTSALPGMGLRH